VPQASQPNDAAATTRAIAAGDEAAFAAFYAAWFAPTLAMAKAACRRDEAFCLDVVQDVMLAVCRRLPALRDERALRAWMAKATCRAAVDRGRAEARRRRREHEVAAAGRSVGEAADVLLDAEQRAWLATAMGELPLVEQKLLAARFEDGDSVTAAGAAFGLSPDASHGRLRRVLSRLRERAREWWHGR
jgi:RNA polymerase sigma factor (sigma-70 family)